MRAFEAPGHGGINYRVGVWHAYMMTLTTPAIFAMPVHDGGSAADCMFADIASVSIALSHAA
ncbi:ureidoglycolate lyase [Methylobacterium sp. P31]